MIFWGGAWVSSKIVTQSIHPQSASFLRIFLTLIAFLPFMFIFKQSFKLNFSQFKRVFISSILFVIYFQLFFFGLSVGMAGIGGVIVTGLNPLFIFVFTLIYYKKQAHIKEMTALFFGLAGTALILQLWQIELQSLLLSGNIFYLIAALTWSLVTLSSQYAQEKLTIWSFSFYLYLFSSIIQFFFALPYHPESSFSQNYVFWLNMAFLAIFPSVFSNTVYFYASSAWGSKKTGFFTFLVPIASILLSWIFIHEIPHFFTLLGSVFVLFAVYLIQTKKEK